MSAVTLLVSLSALSTVWGQETVTVHIARDIPDGISQLSLGITHTQNSLEWSPHSEAVARAKDLLRPVIRYQNQHIMGWGGGNPEPSPGVYDWSSLDYRVKLMQSLGGEMVITLCGAPDWMKGGEPGKTDWTRLEVCPLPAHYGDFAALAAQIARRYSEVKHFQVWNEMKGFWKREANNWNFAAYTEMYNQVYDAVKAARPDAKVGGLYMVIEGSGSEKGGWAAEKPIRARQWEVINYWLAHKRGADFICLDKSLTGKHDQNIYTSEELMGLTRWFGEVARQIGEKTELPIWWSEYYAPAPPGSQELAARYASIYNHMIRGGSSVALLWNPMEGETAHYLFTDTKKPDGGQPTPHYQVYRAVSQHFGPGTQLLKATSSSPDVEVLASATHALLINKRAAPRRVQVDGQEVALGAYEVRTVAAEAPL